MTKVLTDHDRRILDLAQQGRIQEYLDALLEHPEKGRLLRALAQEESAPEHEEFVKRMQAKEYIFHIHRHDPWAPGVTVDFYLVYDSASTRRGVFDTLDEAQGAFPEALVMQHNPAPCPLCETTVE